MKQVDKNNVQMGEFSAKDIAVAGYPLPWAKSFCPFRACCLYPLPWAKSFCPFRACCLYPLLWAKSYWAFSPYINHM